MKNKILKRMATGFLAAALCMGSTMTAFADAEPITAGTLDNPATIAITKELQMPTGIDTPDATFRFTIEKKSFNDDSSDAAKAAMPALSGSVNVRNTAATTTEVVPGEDYKTVVVNTGNLLDSVTFTETGKYIYTVTEQANTYTSADATKETLEYSQAKYELEVWVTQDDTTGVMFPTYTVVYPIITRPGVTAPSTEERGDKIDPTDPGDEGGANSFKFINKYTKSKTAPGDPGDNPVNADDYVKISKVVAGNLASKDKEFTFGVTVTNSSLVASSVYKYTGYVYNEDDTRTGTSYTFISGTSTSVNLKHGQYILIANLPIGNTYVVNETGTIGYVPTAVVTSNGSVITPSLSATAGQDLSSGDQRVTKNTDSVAYTNTNNETVPTGIVTNNLPFITLILVAIAAFAGFLFFKRRKMAR